MKTLETDIDHQAAWPQHRFQSTSQEDQRPLETKDCGGTSSHRQWFFPS